MNLLLHNFADVALDFGKSLSTIDLTHIRILKSPSWSMEEVSDGAEKKFSVIFVLSLPSNFKRRNRVRQEVFGEKISTKALGTFKLVFLLGKANNQTDLHQLDQEAHHYGGMYVKFIHSEKATKFCEIFPLLLTTVHTVKSKGKISQNVVAFSEYMNFK